MRKTLFLLVVISWIAGFTSAFDVSWCQEKVFTVTAYYSPVSGQVFYYKPTFQEEVILNGEWHTGASGKKVFNGMLAWPASYPFGSIIYFPGFGVGEIADRGWAIVISWENGQSHDRIDIWMWRGEEGLIRALTFGKKELTWWYCDSSLVKTSPKNSLLRENVPVLKYFFDVAIRIQQLEEWRNDIRVRTLQKYLNKLGYLNKRYRHGRYDVHTKKALCNYQIAKKIVGKGNPDCGKFGKMTRYAMKLDVQNKWLLPQNIYEKWTFAAIMELAKYYNGKPTTVATIQQWTASAVQQTARPNIFLFYRAYTKWQQSSEIKILQNFLVTEWLYSGAIDGVYSKKTMDAVYVFQKKYWLILENDPLALRGYLWPKTRAKINELRQK